MRIVVVGLFVAVLAVLAFSATVTTSGTSKAFAAQSVTDQIPPVEYCTRYCNGTTIKYCGTTPSGNIGCDHVVNNFCVYHLCRKVETAPEE
jgi:hypothetical protein